MRELAQQLLQAEGERITLADAGAEILSDEQLNTRTFRRSPLTNPRKGLTRARSFTVLDRSDDAMKSTDSSDAKKGATFEVVETIEEETVQQSNILDDLLGDQGDRAASSTQTSDDES